MARDGAAVSDDPRDRPKARSARPLTALWPYMRPHRSVFWGAAVALLLAAAFTLIIPIALGRVVDGFTEERAEQNDQYFLSFFGVALLLSLATAARFYCVTTLGERHHRPAPVNAKLIDLIRAAESGGKRDWSGAELLTVLSTASAATPATSKP